MRPTIKWNADLFGVEIKTENEHFVISAQPSMVMSWNDAVRYLEGSAKWELPTKDQLKIVANNIDKVNEIIEENGGYLMQGLFWAADGSDEFCAWFVLVHGGNTYDGSRGGYYYVRAVSALNN